MPGRPRLASDAAILAATARAIGRVGPARLTLADVAAEIGLAPATLVQRFGSKRGLLLAFAALGPDAVAATFAAARRETDSPLAALVAALTALTRDVDTPEALANHLAFLQVDLSDPEFRHHALAQAAVMREEIRRLQAELRRHPDGPKDLGLVAIDYLQLMSGRKGVSSREQEISEISRGLKQLAKEMAVPVIAHRMIAEPQARFAGVTTAGIVEEILTKVPSPS